MSDQYTNNEPDIVNEYINPNIFNIGGSIISCSTSPNKNMIAVGGRDIFKILNFNLYSNNSTNNNEIFSIAKNLRNSRSNLNSSTNDVKWHPSNSILIL